MLGITSYGGYIPRLRLNRFTIFNALGWFAPAIIAVAQGERSVCNWDEDSLSMAVEASRDCLVGLDKSKIDAVYLCSTTLPYADRQNAGILKTALNLRDDIRTGDYESSLKAGTSALVSALDSVKAGEVNTALITAADARQTKSAYFYEMWFGDGAASLAVGSDGVIAEYKGSYSVSYDFADHYRGAGYDVDYMWEERWVRDEGYSKIIPEAITGLLEKTGTKAEDVAKFVYPCFFKAEHAKIARKLGVTPDKIQDNMHEVCGETGTAHPFVMMVTALEQAQPGDKIVLASFGSGCDAILFEVTENIKKLAARASVSGTLANRKEMDNYEKFAVFRKLLSPEMGIRAEAGGQTAMSVLWRKRDMILGLVGGICEECQTPQYPRMNICVKPDCQAINTQVPYEFADKKASIVMYTGDMLTVSLEPPAVYGLIQFEGGGRFPADFTDCTMDDVSVGKSMRMTFRKRWFDKDRGYHGYFWKATPIQE